MTASSLHRIQRQVIELRLAPGMAGPQAQEALAIEMRERAQPALSAVFDAVAGPDELLRLDRLELDLGTIAGGNWAPDFRERLVAQMERELARFTPEKMRVGRESPKDARAGDTMRQFLFFVAHGRLPWWGTRPEQGFSAAFAAEPATLDWNAVRAAVAGNARACRRLVECLENELLDEAIARWAGLPHALSALKALAPRSLTHGVQRAWRREFWRTLIDWVLGDGFHAGDERELVEALRAARDAIAPTQQPSSSNPGARGAEEHASVVAGLPSPWREWLAEPEGGVAAAATAAADRTSVRAPASQALSRPKAKPALRAISKQPEEAIYLPGAGVMLLHPFLEALFRDRGLLEGRDFRDAGARQRAIRLIGLLAFGTPETPEYDLVLAKLLCAHPLDEPVAEVALDDDDVAACDAMLRAVLGHWTALRSASVPWLRTQFFLRDGKLETVEAGFRLTVERRAQDVLLTRLPWGFGVVGLPWMKERIFVHWLD